LVALTTGADSSGTTLTSAGELMRTPPPIASLPVGQVAVTDFDVSESLTLVSVT